MIRRRDALKALGIVPLAGAKAQTPTRVEPFLFAVLADTQLGFWTAREFPQERARCEFLVAEMNRLKPRFVVVCGDLINSPANQFQADAYRSIFAALDPAIHLYNVPGNHDLSDNPPPSADNYKFYERNFGKLYYSFREGSVFGIVLDSTSLKHPNSPEAKVAAEAERVWFRNELREAQKSGALFPVVFQHHPWYIWNDFEPETYFDMPVHVRDEMIPWLLESGVHYTFSGHMHANRVVRFKNTIEFVTSGSVTAPNFGSKNGVRLVIVHQDRLEHRYFGLGALPRAIDLEKGFPPIEAL
jgi:3',5'-cyclic AMP phosphodiesterase CpdA